MAVDPNLPVGQWDGEFLAYLTGYFMADGNLDKRPYGIKFTSIDLAHLVYLRSWAAWGNIYRQSEAGDEYSAPSGHGIMSNDLYDWRFGHRLYYRWLLDKGITSRKTFTGIKWIDFGLNQRHFVRGYTDGDGSIGFRERMFGKYPYVSWKSGCLPFLAELKSYYNLQNKLRKNFEVSGNNCFVVLEDAYMNFNFGMERKAKSADLILRQGRKVYDHPRWRNS
jgi:hypothetical protein